MTVESSRPSPDGDSSIIDSLSYRLAQAHDCALLARFNRQLIAERGDTGSSDFGELLKRMQTWLATRRYAAVLFDDGRQQTVAYALYREHRKEIYLRQFLVTHSARRHGYGRRAIELLKSKIWTPGKRLTVEVLVENEAAYRFWQSLGYRNYAVTLEIPPETNPAGATSPANLLREPVARQN